MRYSNALEIIAMTLMWAAVLIWYDIAFNQHFFRPDVSQLRTLPTSPEVSLWIQHVGCNDKTAEVLQALRSIAWLDKPELKRAQEMPGADAEGAARRPDTQCDIGVLAKVPHVEQADFVEIERVLAPLNVVPTTIEFGGIPHFALKARLANLSCESCARAALEALSPRKDPKFGVTFKWLDSKRVNLKEETITAFVRFNNPVHVDEMTRALTQAGLPPLSLRLVLE